VLDSKWVDLHSEYIIWNDLVHFLLYIYIYTFLHTCKKCTKAYHIICLLCRYTHLERPTQLNFHFIIFVIQYIFQITLECNLTGFGKFIGWYRPFHKLGDFVEPDPLPLSPCLVGPTSHMKGNYKVIKEATQCYIVIFLQFERRGNELRRPTGLSSCGQGFVEFQTAACTSECAET
jgi:hypothetical protein